MPYRFGHIKNAFSLAVERVISTAPNGANLVIDAPIAEEVFTSLGIDDRQHRCCVQAFVEYVYSKFIHYLYCIARGLCL
jgi:3-mercaptopyruvate sulfurtransferase SseA